MAVVAVIGVCIVLVLARLARAQLLRRRFGRAGNLMTEPRSLVRLLRNDEELDEAVARAVAYEEQIAQAVAGRIDRYRQASHVAPIVALDREPDRTAPEGPERASA